METIKTIAIESYVAEVSRLAKTGKATEHTFRGALAALIDALGIRRPRRGVYGPRPRNGRATNQPIVRMKRRGCAIME